VSTSSLCTTYCDAVAKCDETAQVTTCTNDCADEYSVLVPLLRSDYLGNVLSCFETTDCATLLDNGEAVTKCAASAGALASPSAAAQSFCTKAVTTMSGCSESLDQADCLDGIKDFADSTIASATACLQESCTSMDACLAAALDSGGIEYNPWTGGATVPVRDAAGG
jgi:hypothetical protein